MNEKSLEQNSKMFNRMSADVLIALLLKLKFTSFEFDLIHNMNLYTIYELLIFKWYDIKNVTIKLGKNPSSK